MMKCIFAKQKSREKRRGESNESGFMSNDSFKDEDTVKLLLLISTCSIRQSFKYTRYISKHKYLHATLSSLTSFRQCGTFPHFFFPAESRAQKVS